jgi:hypothetical protein
MPFLARVTSDTFPVIRVRSVRLYTGQDDAMEHRSAWITDLKLADRIATPTEVHKSRNSRHLADILGNLLSINGLF